MNKTILTLIGAIAILAIATYFRSKVQETYEQNVKQADSTDGSEVASNASTNLHFENLHANPTVQ